MSAGNPLYSRAEVRRQLEALAEPGFCSFTKSLMPGVENVIGVRLPLLRRIARKIAKADWREYLNEVSDSSYEEISYEEIMLQGMVIGCLKEEPEMILELVRGFVPKIDNWSVCDSFCAGLKITKEIPDRMWEFLQDYLKDSRPYYLRFAIVMMIQYFIDEEHICRVLALLDGIRREDYYVKMAVAWAVSICYVKFPEPSMDYLKKCCLDDFTYNKALSKITESLCVDKETKQVIRKMKRPKSDIR